MNICIDVDSAKDFSCEGIYLENCRKQKVIPASYFLRHLKDTEITLKHHGLGAPGIRPVSAGKLKFFNFFFLLYGN